ncbi:glycoside hydrolase family 2 protein [Paratractidigestivibacter sp.]|uniref:glycoside hydrolase family 2 protein n=1 Tax=Paratractidigestivibacter sp. TaxID=2847316 RepID=UPI002ACB0B17|nr:glycoside hydrolase family 2 TIM barrel-domain containing protein [Paratractidigestivibacter sp.]
MLDFARVLKVGLKHPAAGPLIPLTTPWGERILAGEEPAWSHPRPQFARDGAICLNGWWGFSAGTDALDRQVRVPFSPEAALSGIGERTEPGCELWYRRELPEIDLAGGKRALLHFEAVDWECEVWVNDVRVGGHKGAYLPFALDITEALAAKDSGTAVLKVRVCDPGDAGTQLRGKQSSTPGGIWYTTQSGIWRDVWLEVVPATHLTSLQVDASLDGEVSLTVGVDGAGAEAAVVRARILDEGEEVAAAAGVVGAPLCVRIPQPRLWSPADPHLYDVELTLGDDVVRSYFGMREVEVRPDVDGCRRFFLNGEPLFMRGVLDQGYWPDGLMTPPSPEALEFDIRSMLDAGFNLLRKHIKVEDGRFYELCDRLGMLVMQDVPCGGDAYSSWHSSKKPTLFRASWTVVRDTGERAHRALAASDAAYREEWVATCEGMVELLRAHPSVVAWCLFNEGWGQFDAAEAAQRVWALDPTRPVDATSGWYDQGVGDFWSIHNYFRPLGPERCRAAEGRAYLLSEFGGVTLAVAGHVSREDTYGYVEAADGAGFRREVAGLLAQADALEAQGCAGFVYTQLSDVEEEVNGLLTYDRRVNKLAG